MASTHGSEPGGASASDEAKDLIKELNKAILALRTLIEREYPNRREIEAKFVNKSAWDARLRILLITILLSSVLSFGATIGAMAYCYLGTSHPPTCNLIPGYKESEEARQKRLDQIEKIAENRERLSRLEEKLARLEEGR